MNIATLRKKAGLTQQELAEKMEVSQPAISFWETGAKHPPSKILPKLASALRCSIGELYGET